MTRGQAAPITVLILTSIVVVIGVWLIGYVGSIVASYQEQGIRADLLVRLSASTLAYVEHYYSEGNDTSVVFIGVADISGSSTRYYFLALASSGSETPSIANWSVIDPSGIDYGIEGPIAPSRIMLYAGKGVYMPLSQLYPGLSSPAIRLPWLVYGPGYTKPYLARLELRWANKVQPYYIIVLARIGNEYYEVTRLYVPG